MTFSSKISNWYLENKRPLPWREDVQPYRTWLSEVILQQTRVNQGLPYYFKFIEAFPTVNDLATAKEDTVLKLWQGLGYYSRARNLQKTAQLIQAEFGGIFPKSYSELIKLKGIGPYTAAAIASICNEEKVAVVDGNVYRVLSRYFNIDMPIDSTEGKKYFNQLANELLITDSVAPSIHNQAIMELGALICTPKNTLCVECPLQFECEGKLLNTIDKLPVKAKKTSVKNRYFHYLIFKDSNGNSLINKRINKDIWEGLYEFPLLEKTAENTLIEEIIDSIKELTLHLTKDFTIKKNNTTYKHKLSHQNLTATFYVVNIVDLLPHKTTDYQTISLSDVQNYPLPQLIQNYLNNEFENLLSL